MKQVAQRPRTGEIVVVEAPEPVLRPGFVLVENRFSLLSAGTERSKVEFGRKGLIAKARSRPDLVRQVTARARAEGLRSTIALARERLDALAPLGYSSAGVVLRVGQGVEGLAPGDRVACAGAGFASHAEVVAVPRNLVARVPDGVELDAAAYATVGAIALHSVRQAEASIGERVGVVGLGLVGQLALRILAAAGCDAVGIDPDPAACELARDSGSCALLRDDPALEHAVRALTNGIGLDAVLVCAATRSSDPLDLAARLARDRARLVLVGDVPVQVDRTVLYEKELELRLSRSYGPGRYDREYEERGRDLPPGYVRWTEQRNLGAFLGLVAAGRVDPSPLTTHRLPISRAAEAYTLLSSPPAGQRPFGVLLEYDLPHSNGRVPVPVLRGQTRPATGPRVGLIGTGSFARSTLLPLLRELRADLAAVASEGGLSAADAASRLGFERAASVDEILADPSIDAVIVSTRHDAHAHLAAAALHAGKVVLCEKPLALSIEDLGEVEDAAAAGGTLMVGFNRRHAPLVERLARELAGVPGAVLHARINAGPLPEDHWLHDLELGGGRLVGEACHFVDLLAHLAGSSPVSTHAVAAEVAGKPLESSDQLVATIAFASGAVGSLVYAGGGDPRLPKERVEAFGGGLAAVLDDFRRLELWRGGKRKVLKARKDKGHRAELALFLEVAAGRAEPPDPATYFASSRATLALAESLRVGRPVEVTP